MSSSSVRALAAREAPSKPHQILDQHEQMQRIGRRRDKVKAFVEFPGRFVFRVCNERPQPGDVSSLERAEDRVLEHATPDPLSLHVTGNGQPRQHHDGHGISRQPLGDARRSRISSHLTEDERVVTDNAIAGQCEIGLSRVRQLAEQSVPHQKRVERLATGCETVDVVRPREFFDPKPPGHSAAASNGPRERSSFFSRGNGRGRASRAARNDLHPSSLMPNRCRSGSVSAARRRALSSTNSLKLRDWERAAAWSVFFASELIRRSSFSERIEDEATHAPP